MARGRKQLYGQRQIACATLIGALAITAGLLSGQAAAAPPPNDSFASPQVLGGPLPIAVTGDAREATTEPGDPGLGSLWYTWTAPHDMRISLEQCVEGPESSEVLVEFFTGSSLQTLRYVGDVPGTWPPSGACPFPNPGYRTDSDLYDVVAGTEYRIRVGDASTESRFGLALTQVPQPPNDKFSDSQVLSGRLPIVSRGTTAEASTEPGEPGGEPGSELSVWYLWKAPRSGRFAIETCTPGEGSGASTSHSARVFTGSSVSSLEPVRSAYDYARLAYCPYARQPTQADPLEPELKEFTARAAQTYRIQVSGPGKPFGIALREEEVYDIAVSVAVSRTRVPIGGTVRATVKLTNRGNIPVPTRAEPRLAFGGEINLPGQPNHVGRALYARVRSRSRGANCGHGTYGFGSKLQVFACRVVRLAPGESETAVLKITKIRAPIMLDSHAPGGDDRPGNDERRPVVRVGGAG